MEELTCEMLQFEGTEEQFLAALVDFAAKYGCTLTSNENGTFSLLSPDGGQLTTGIVRRAEEQSDDCQC